LKQWGVRQQDLDAYVAAKVEQHANKQKNGDSPVNPPAERPRRGGGRPRLPGSGGVPFPTKVPWRD
jgi:hypothetical protein